jgi:hypothetical protein
LEELIPAAELPLSFALDPSVPFGPPCPCVVFVGAVALHTLSDPGTQVFCPAAPVESSRFPATLRGSEFDLSGRIAAVTADAAKRTNPKIDILRIDSFFIMKKILINEFVINYMANIIMILNYTTRMQIICTFRH